MSGGVVKNKHIARLGQLRQVGKTAIFQHSAMRIQQAAATALLRRVLCDQPFRQGKIEFIGTHGHGENIRGLDYKG